MTVDCERISSRKQIEIIKVMMKKIHINESTHSSNVAICLDNSHTYKNNTHTHHSFIHSFSYNLNLVAEYPT